ncbi:Crp/Fnr family transcriptional regulator [Candidatus Mycobacterium methanotrophicum]|uniref:Crp/Fnr family transcriptional regulator n=1 Tax=Candidatus Mycobacterium methanotrophicum TaxID=2943498 RepID=A0ABY4QMJ9_9MYCO|nr:Crp/Fnr family transcriptional regulator [Candidatus Mycobacterium methanotrophicum]UQX12104.1 Crp/Fnr family transcriptional regulator [Candidatus Mycobacterium methanotrophicum]
MTEEGVRRNAILAQLPESEFDELARRLRLERTEIKHVGYAPGKPITDIYFPLTSVYSLVAIADGKFRLEVATVGYEGMVGLPAYLGAGSSLQAAFCQVAGDTVGIGVEDFRQALGRGGALRALMNRFTQATMVQVAQNVVCNRSHSTDVRMARWLLTTQDRVGRDEFPLTQDFLAQMLGVRRPTVSDTAHRIQADGLIRYRRGVVVIADRGGLEQKACECYRIVKAEFDDLRNHRRGG